MNASKVTEQRRRQYADLDSRYGKIGISAVVAALQYSRKPLHSLRQRLSGQVACRV
jgi:hypothetical protein